MDFQGIEKRESSSCISDLILNKRRADFAGLVLLWIESFFKEDAISGENLFQSLLEYSPNGALYFYMAGYLSRKQGDINLSIERFSTCLNLSSQFFEIENISKYEIGWCHYLNNNFETAKDLFEEFLSNHTSKTYKAWCYWQLAC